MSGLKIPPPAAICSEKGPYTDVADTIPDFSALADMSSIASDGSYEQFEYISPTSNYNALASIPDVSDSEGVLNSNLSDASYLEVSVSEASESQKLAGMPQLESSTKSHLRYSRFQLSNKVNIVTGFAQRRLTSHRILRP